MRSPRAVTAFEAKNRIGQLLDRVQAGEELVITRHGKPVARLVPVREGDGSGLKDALRTFRSVRAALAEGGKKVSRKEVRDWRDAGRR